MKNSYDEPRQQLNNEDDPHKPNATSPELCHPLPE